MNTTTFDDSFSYKLIYVFEIKDARHKGLLKIGDASIKSKLGLDDLPQDCKILNEAAKDRIKKYTTTAGISFNLLHTELAVITEINKKGNVEIRAFRDYDVHRVLENSNFTKKKLGNSREWFEIDLNTAKKAIEAVKHSIYNIGNCNTKKEHVEIIFRPEQEKAIEKTVKQFKTTNRMLWNAKMRFGKTLSALKVIEKCEFKKTIIVTHRPVVDDGWYDDFRKIFYNNDTYLYGSKNHGNTVESLLNSNKNFVYFASIQDLRGSEEVGGKYEKNDIVFEINWDLVIVDEAHEGTTTALGNDVIKAIVKDNNNYNTKFLALSGTPFNILGNYDNNIYTWDYVMEQKSKTEWDKIHFGDSNPYEELPELNIFTYNLGTLLDNKYIEIDDKAFNFREFFRTWTGDITYDFRKMSKNAKIGDFVHEEDVWQFLNLITKANENSYYPFSTEKYRNIFKHTLWMLPGIKEAKAFSNLMKKHPIFGSGVFEIVNVAGDGDNENDNALNLVKNAIKSAGEDGYTITLSCGKLTTGVTVPEWTAVFMLAGSYSTSAANYLQTIFRVQSPCNKNGKIKTSCYVFDFAPDRTLKMVAESVSISTKAGKQNESDRKILGEFLNYCPVVSIDGTNMKKYDTSKLLQQLKRAYVERAIKNGFDDTNLYNDELSKLQPVDFEKFKQLDGIIGKVNALPKHKELEINKQGLTDEEYDEITDIKKKPKKGRTAEEEARIKELEKQKKQRNKARSILRSISIRMPLLIYGADIDINEDITMNKLIDIVDDASWIEFMPIGVTKDIFKEFIKYYDKEIFIAAGKRIRNIVSNADLLSPVERVKKIAELFSCFKNPDKETVLTPWRVVNMHMGDCIGGYNFFNENYKEKLELPRYIKQGKVTGDIFNNSDVTILEINSKTGLYPLYMAYSIFENRCKNTNHNHYYLMNSKSNELWKNIIANNIFIICKTPMAKQITKRTLLGYSNGLANAHYFENLINYMKNKSDKFVERISRVTYWKKKGSIMKFDAIVGNPPYQTETGGAGRQAKPLYNLFVEQSKKLKPKYISMIMPSRWFAGGMGLENFRKNMMNDRHISYFTDYVNAKECFPQISISGGVCYFLYDSTSNDECYFTNVVNGKKTTLKRPLDEFPVLVRYNSAVSILRKIHKCDEISLSTIVSSLTPYGLTTDYRGYTKKRSKNDVRIHASDGSTTYIDKNKITKGFETIDKYKVIMSKTSAEHAGEPGKDGKFKVFTSSTRVIGPSEICTHSYFIIGQYDNSEIASNLLVYLKSKFVRFLILLALSSINLSKAVFLFVPIQDFNKIWTDQELYKKYGLDKDEIKFIESMIKPIE